MGHPPEASEVACSIVIPTKNGGVYFERVLSMLQAQSLWARSELIIIDSESTDGTFELAIQAGANAFTIPSNSFNHGAARDFGISKAHGDFVVLLVQDAEPVGTTFLEAMLSPFDNSEVAGVYARQVPRPNANMLTKRRLNNWLTARREPEIRKMKSVDWYQALSPIEKLHFCNFDNVCSAVRKSVWNQYQFGSIDFGEDIDWAERVLRAGMAVAYEPSASVIHSHDRPLKYEYKRTYVCHRKLYQLFGLHLVKNVRSMPRAWLHSTVQDMIYIIGHRGSLAEKINILARAFGLNFVSAVAQYRAVRDEVRGQSNLTEGV